jgi:hypothetical protein
MGVRYCCLGRFVMGLAALGMQVAWREFAAGWNLRFKPGGFVLAASFFPCSITDYIYSRDPYSS